MTAKPNTNDTSDYANNYYCIPNDICIYRLGLSDMIVDYKSLDCAYWNSRISLCLPSNEGLKDSNWLVNIIEQKMMDMNVPYNDIHTISMFFAGVENEVTEKLLKIRGCINYIE